jgi:peptide deformylase
MLKILTDDNKILRRKSKRVSKIDDTIKTLCSSLVSTMILNNGVGLAAPQCGILKQIIVALIEGEPKVFINPEIISKSDILVSGEEGCLSIPETFIEKKRPQKITVKYRNIKGFPCLETYEGFSARVLQHEIDHLLGILMTDETV